jgi:hypothetical protein
MDIFKTKNMLAVGLSGIMSVGAAQASVVSDDHAENANSIVAVSGPNVRVTLYDGIATVVGVAESGQEANDIEREIASLDGVDHVINLIAW